MVQVFVDGKKDYVNVDEAARLEKETKDGKFKYGETVCKAGQILCLTANEAVKFDLAKGLTKDQDDLLKQIGMAGATVVEAKIAGKPFTDWVTKSFDSFKAEFNAAASEVDKDINQAEAMSRQRDVTQRGTPQWNELTQRATACLKKAAETIKTCEKRIEDDFGVDAAKEYKETLSGLKTRMEGMYTHLSAN